MREGGRTYISTPRFVGERDAFNVAPGGACARDAR